MEINKEVIKRFANSDGYEHFEALLKEEMVKIRDVLNIKGENGRDMDIEVIARQEAYKMIERLFRRIGVLKAELNTPKKRSFK